GESLKRSPRRIRPMADEARQGLLNGTAFAKATPNVFASRRLGKRVTSLRARLRLGRQGTGDRWDSLGLGAFCLRSFAREQRCVARSRNSWWRTGFCRDACADKEPLRSSGGGRFHRGVPRRISECEAGTSNRAVGRSTRARRLRALNTAAPG